MRLGPENGPDNPLMVLFTYIPGARHHLLKVFSKLQFFTWESKHESMNWWRHLEVEIPRLAKMGFTQLWLPPPNKAAATVRSDARLKLGAS